MSDLEAAEWELDKDINEGGEIGVLRFSDGLDFEIEVFIELRGEFRSDVWCQN